MSTSHLSKSAGHTEVAARPCCGKAHRIFRKNCFALSSEVSPRTKTPIKMSNSNLGLRYDRSKLDFFHAHKRGARVEVSSGHHYCCRTRAQLVLALVAQDNKNRRETIWTPIIVTRSQLGSYEAAVVANPRRATSRE